MKILHSFITGPVIVSFLLMLSQGLHAQGSSPEKTKATKPLNVLFIAVDDLRPELGCYGNTVIKTPNIDRLASLGTVFTRAYCQQAVCNPSRASLLTGLRPDATGVTDLFTNFRKNIPDAVTLPQYFKNNGYFTENIGKIFHNNIQDSVSWNKMVYLDGYPYDPDAVYRDLENIARVNERIKELRSKGDTTRYIDQFGKWYIKTMSYEISDVADEEYFDGAQTTFSIGELARLKDSKQPFFYGLGYYHPHLPFNAPRKYWDMYDRDKIPPAENNFVPNDAPWYAMDFAQELRFSYSDFKGLPSPLEGGFNEQQSRLLKHGYYASVSYVDAQIGRLLKALDSLGMTDNTLIVLWGDNGWKLGEHNGWTKQTNYEVDTRVPLIICMPGALTKGVKCDALVELVDIYPTVCEMAGLKVAESLQGTSMQPLIYNPRQPWKTAAFSEFVMGVFRKRADGKKWIGYAMRTERYRYVEWFDMKTNKLTATELYDEITDPQENQNIAGFPENKSIVIQLSGQMKAGWQNARPKEH